jgi:hypothetical protein
MDHVNVSAANWIEWSCLMLAILELPLFMCAEAMTEQATYIASKLARAVQGKKLKAITYNPCDGGRRPNLLFHRSTPHSSSNKGDGGRW